MQKFYQNKLFRDKIPQILQEQGSILHISDLTDQEYDKCLREKLLEELREVQVASSFNDIVEELADVLEVIEALCALHGIDNKKIERVKQRKQEQRGGFYSRAYVTVIEHPQGSQAAQYCLAHPDKYPEVPKK